jgi:CTP:molybdopterin cytidylyltransferase MocA
MCPGAGWAAAETSTRVRHAGKPGPLLAGRRRRRMGGGAEAGRGEAGRAEAGPAEAGRAEAGPGATPGEATGGVATHAVVGVLLAAGEGSRLGAGRAKALVTDAAGVTWVARSAAALVQGGAQPVYVVVGADAQAVRRAAPPGCVVVETADWREGMGASLRAGLAAVAAACPDAAAAVVMLVDTPGVGAEVVRRLVALATPEGVARATYDGEPGHPVILGSRHWSAVLEAAAGDSGARDYLRGQQVRLVECGDVGSGTDIDTAEALSDWQRRRPPSHR